MKYGWVVIVAIFVLAGNSCLSMADECNVLAIEDRGEGVFELILDTAPLLEPGFTGEWIFKEGPDPYNGISRPIRQEGIVVIATLSGRSAGEYVEFIYGRGGNTWLVPGCPAEDFNYHFRVQLIDTTPDKAPPLVFLPLLLNNK